MAAGRDRAKLIKDLLVRSCGLACYGQRNFQIRRARNADLSANEPVDLRAKCHFCLRDLRRSNDGSEEKNLVLIRVDLDISRFDDTMRQWPLNRPRTESLWESPP